MSDDWYQDQLQQLAYARQQAEDRRREQDLAVERIRQLDETIRYSGPAGVSYDPIAPVAAITPTQPEYREEDQRWKQQQFEELRYQQAQNDALMERLRDEERLSSQLYQEQQYLQQRQNDADLQERRARELFEQARIDDERAAREREERLRATERIALQQDDVRRDEERASRMRADVEAQQNLLSQLRLEQQRANALLEEQRSQAQQAAEASQAQVYEAARQAAERADAASTARAAEQYRQSQADAWVMSDQSRTLQQAANEQAERARSYAAAFTQPLGSTPQIRELWERASAGGADYNAARNQFWQYVNHDRDDSNAKFVREMLEAANFQIRRGGQPPLLNVQTGAKNPFLDYQDRLLTLDHRDSQSDFRARALESERRAAEARSAAEAEQHRQDAENARRQATEASNLQFMLWRDNMFRGNRFTPNEVPKSGYQR